MAWAGEADAKKVWPWLVPLTKGHITQFFKGGFSGSGENGIDLGMPMGTPVTSLTAGTVLTSGYYAGGGVVTVESTLPLGIGAASVYYQHLDLNNPALHPGSVVKVGDLIGWSGGQLSGGHHPSTRQFSSGPHIEIGINAPFSKNGLWHPLGPNINPLPWLQALVANGPGTTDIIASSPTPVGGTVQLLSATVKGAGPVADSFVAIEQRMDSLMTIRSPGSALDWTDIFPWNWPQAQAGVTNVIAQDVDAVIIRAICILLGLVIIIAFLVNLMKPAFEEGAAIGGQFVGGAVRGAATGT
jgi:hypothetical protein